MTNLGQGGKIQFSSWSAGGRLVGRRLMVVVVIGFYSIEGGKEAKTRTKVFSHSNESFGPSVRSLNESIDRTIHPSQLNGYSRKK